jgi:glutamine synthetase
VNSTSKSNRTGVASVAKSLKKEGIQFVLSQFVDINGVPKAKMVPVSEFENLVANGVGFAGFATSTEMGQQPHQPDIMTIPDLSTMAVLPWKKNTAWFAANLYVEGKPWPYCTRTILRNYLKKVHKQTSLSFKTGIEPEFYLVRREQGRILPYDDVETVDKPCYDLKLLGRNMEFLQTLNNYFNELGWHSEATDHEDGPAQYEVNLRYDDALTTADKYTFFKFAVSNLANTMGAVASFMPKPFTNRTGNGAHFHMSLWEDGKNLFPDSKDPQKLGLSKIAYHFIGGLLKHAKAYIALSAPTVNSYKRLVAGGSASGATWAPVYISYGGNNRTQMIRVSSGEHVEDRTPDSACNPYLAATAMLAAGIDGVENKFEPGPVNKENMYRMSEEDLGKRGIQLLPSSLKEAVEELRRDKVIVDALGREFVENYSKLKLREWNQYHTTVGQWEVDHYLTYL